jgi:hypothetical protein
MHTNKRAFQTALLTCAVAAGAPCAESEALLLSQELLRVKQKRTFTLIIYLYL